ncbi:MAG: AAA family ATPase [Gammaproteobacteria bacterium]|nr:AAA family ATPase [Gammaproteobacteria bacterium]NNF60030.1 AAA family ATPase [Gammaproteobacteria bacterium]NNM19961.1 AAA family ATPase [Gammaproteobacteria bacterium]
MAKAHIVDTKDQARVPFLRGILTRSLRDAGLTFEEAYDIASVMRDRLGDAEISSDQLRIQVAELLRKRYDTSVVERYLARRKRAPATILVESGDGLVTPFSRGRHMQFLEASGLTVRQAEPVTARVYEHLLRKGVTKIPTCRLSHLTYLALKKSLGNKAAKRYLVWFQFAHSGQPLLILIGGTVGCGKSTLATALAHKLDVVRIQSTDMLREVMRMMVPERMLPVLHTSSFNAWRKLPFADVRQADPEVLIADGYQSQAELLAVAGEAVLNRARKERVALILEGVHIQPAFAESLRDVDDAIIVPLVLAVLKQKELRKRIKGRGTQAPRRRARRYLREFDSIWRLQSFLLSEADRCDVPIVSNIDKEKATHEVVRVVIDRLTGVFHGKPRQVFGIIPGHNLPETMPGPARSAASA